MIGASLLVTLLSWGGPALSEPSPSPSPVASPSPSPSPSPTPAPAPDPYGATYRVWAGVEHSYTAESSQNHPVAGAEAEFPLVGKAGEVARIRTTIVLSALPGKPALDLSKPETWGEDMEFSAAVVRRIAQLGVHRTSLLAVAGWATAKDSQVLERFARNWRVGLELSNTQTRALLQGTLGHDDLVKVKGLQVGVAGQFPLGPGPAGSTIFVRGSATLAFKGGGEVVRLAAVVVR